MPTDRQNLFNSDYADMARALLDAGAEFMLVGGFAVSVHGAKDAADAAALEKIAERRNR